MKIEPDFDFDMFELELESFQRDVYLLILNTLDKGLTALSGDMDEKLAEIDAAKAKFGSSTRLAEDHVEVLEVHWAQQNFLTSQALVALASRLQNAINQCAKYATFRPRIVGRYPGKNEWLRIWREYTERFGFNFEAETDRIAFIRPMIEARNRIVHNGSEANTVNEDGEEDTSFSKSYPDYVFGDGFTAVVHVSEELLKQNVEQSISLLQWISETLRKKELESRTPG